MRAPGGAPFFRAAFSRRRRSSSSRSSFVGHDVFPVCLKIVRLMSYQFHRKRKARGQDNRAEKRRATLYARAGALPEIDRQEKARRSGAVPPVTPKRGPWSDLVPGKSPVNRGGAQSTLERSSHVVLFGCATATALEKQKPRRSGAKWSLRKVPAARPYSLFDPRESLPQRQILVCV